jgi:hypothetical protein
MEEGTLLKMSVQRRGTLGDEGLHCKKMRQDAAWEIFERKIMLITMVIFSFDSVLMVRLLRGIEPGM